MFDLKHIEHFAINTDFSRLPRPSLIQVQLSRGYSPKDPRLGSGSFVGMEDIEIYSPQGQDRPGDWVKSAWDVPDNPNSESSFSFISECLQRCLIDHVQEECGAPNFEPIFPKRVVKIGGDLGLIQVIEYEERLGPYLALSHCWGGNISLQLTSFSPSLFESIDFQSMPNTFRDAIQLTRRLSYQYIWTDSLCIKQDSATDWEIEANKMGAIYRNAHLTIAASSSKGSAVSFLAPRPRIGPPQQDLSFTDRDGKLYHLQARRPLSIHEHCVVEDGPLHKRAWCFQEYYLSGILSVKAGYQLRCI